MSEALYHEAIVALARDQSCAGSLDGPKASATVDNPLCGDRVSIDLAIDNGRIAGIRHRVRGCLLCQASAAALSKAAVGQTGEEIAVGAKAVDEMLRSVADKPVGNFDIFGAFLPVVAHRSRHDCVKLPLLAAVQCIAKLVTPPR